MHDYGIGGGMEFGEYLGETTEYEKKQAVEKKKVKNWLKSISAFANTAGGVLVFGVSNDDNLIGIDNIKEESEFVSQKIKERIFPFPNVVMRIFEIMNKVLLYVYVPRGEETPYFYVGDGIKEAYIRIGNESVIADTTELKRLVLRGKNGTFDSLSSAYRFEDFSFTKLRERYKSWSGQSMTEKAFESLCICDSDGYLTNAGALLADDSPIRHSRLFCTRWNGLDKSGGKIDALDSAEYSGSIILLLNEGMMFIKRNMKTLWQKTGDSRIEMPDYCERSVFEALVNALIHRDYLISGSEVHIDIFDDKIVIYSPGGMIDGSHIQERNIDNVPSIRRNPVLADVFSRLGYMERQGSGLNKIKTGYEKCANYKSGLEPSFVSSKETFMVTLPNLNFLASDEAKKPLAEAKNSSDEAKKLSDEAKNSSAEAKNSSCEAKNEAKNPSREAKKPSAEAKNSSREAKNSSNEAKNSSREAKNEAKNQEETDKEELLKNAIELNPKISQREIASQTSLSKSTVQRIIKKLVQEGKIERVGSKKGGKWIIK